MRRFSLLAVTALIAACGSDGPEAPEVVTGEAVSADGVPIWYEARGAGEPTLVLIHGWANDRSIWGEHRETLSRTHRVVTVELAGHGASGLDRSEWTIDAFGDDVVAVADALQLNDMVLVGFSLGAAVVLEAAERMPERVAGVVFVDFFKDPDRQITAAAAEEVGAMFRANWGDTAFIRAYAFSPDAPDSLVQAVTYGMPDQPREEWFPALTALGQWLETQFAPTLRGLDVPVAAITTTAAPTDVEAMRQLAPGFTLDTIAGVGHAGILLRRVGDFDAKLLAIVDRFSEDRD